MQESYPPVHKKRITYDAIIDHLLVNPSATRRELAQQFNYTPEGIGLVLRTEMFQARLAERRESLVDPLIKASLEERFEQTAHATLDILNRRLTTSDDPKLALATLEAVSRARQYGAAAATPVVQNNFVVHLPGPARSADAWEAAYAPPRLAVDAA